MYCTDCGDKNATESKFCRRCGHSLERIETAASGKVNGDDYIRALPDDERMTALLEKASDLKTAGNLTGAILVCNEAISITPNSASAYSLLGQLLTLQGDIPGAVRAYESALVINPDDIADRVKLEELKRNSPHSSTNAPVFSPVRFADSQRSPLRSPSLLVPILLGIGGMVLGASFVALWRNTGTKTESITKITPVQPGSTGTNPTPPVEVAQNNPSTSGNTGTVPGLMSGTNTNLFPNNLLSPNREEGKTAPTTERNPIPPKVRARGTTPSPEPTSSENLTVKAGSDRTLKIQPPEGVKTSVKVREMLDGEDNVSTTGNSTMKFEIDTGQRSNAKSADNGISKNATRVETGGGGGARSARMIAEDLKLKGDFSRAIPQYQKALGGAGDDAGYLYQQIGYCFLRKGGKASAKSNYERAATEYRRLIAAGRQVETAQSGLRYVETGIKLCD